MADIGLKESAHGKKLAHRVPKTTSSLQATLAGGKGLRHSVMRGSAEPTLSLGLVHLGRHRQRLLGLWHAAKVLDLISRWSGNDGSFLFYRQRAADVVGLSRHRVCRLVAVAAGILKHGRTWKLFPCLSRRLPFPRPEPSAAQYQQTRHRDCHPFAQAAGLVSEAYR